MIDIEIIGNEGAISAAKAPLERLTDSSAQEYRHRGMGGEAGLFGLAAAIAPAVIPQLFDLLKRLLIEDRTLKVTFNGWEAEVRNVPELADLLDLLRARGIIR